VERSKKRGKHAPQTVRSAGITRMTTSLLSWTSRNEAVFVYMRGAETVRAGAGLTRSYSCSSGLHCSADGGEARRPYRRALDLALDAGGAEAVIGRPRESTSQKPGARPRRRGDWHGQQGGCITLSLSPLGVYLTLGDRLCCFRII
jgi:hypothetical protein